MFTGATSLSIDAKGRLAVPSRFRERLMELCGGRMVVTISLFNECLSLYPAPHWQQLGDEIGALPADPGNRAIQQLLFGYAEDVELDSNGRILLGASLREFAHLSNERKLKMLGQGHRFEIWDEARWNEEQSDLLGKARDNLSTADALRSLVSL